MFSLTRLTKPALVFALISAVYLLGVARDVAPRRGVKVVDDDDVVVDDDDKKVVVASKDVEKEVAAAVKEEELKTILMWNDGYGNKELGLGFGGPEMFRALGCEETRCRSTEDRNLLPKVSDFDAVVFHMLAMQSMEDLPKERSPHQGYVYWVMETPQNNYVCPVFSSLNGFFNWTMTYRRDSDFPHPYGNVHRVKDHPEEGPALDKFIKDFGKKNAAKYARGKDDFKAAWFVSNCASRSGRDRYVEQMRSAGITVDIFGQCGTLQCPRSNETACYLDMAEKYRFYLSYENSICEDYLTEKFYNILKYNVVPVGFGGGAYAAVAPKKSFVSAMDFPTAADLVKHLRELQEDDAAYAEHFWWKEFYEVRADFREKSLSYCGLCKKLHERDPVKKVYEDIADWWVTKANCRTVV